MPASEQDDEAVLEAEVDQGVEHREGLLRRRGHSQQPAPMAPFMISVLSRNAPVVTTRWPGLRPQATSTTSPRSVGLTRTRWGR